MAFGILGGVVWEWYFSGGGLVSVQINHWFVLIFPSFPEKIVSVVCCFFNLLWLYSLACWPFLFALI